MFTVGSWVAIILEKRHKSGILLQKSETSAVHGHRFMSVISM